MRNIKKGPCITMGLKSGWKVRTAFKNSKYCAATEFLNTGINLPISECREVPDQPSSYQHPSQIQREGERDRQTDKTHTEVFNASW
jgi:hypothetical protein